MPGSKFIPKTQKKALIPEEHKDNFLEWKNPQEGETLYEVDTKSQKIRAATIVKRPMPLPHIKGLVLPKLVVKKEGVLYIAAKDREELIMKLVKQGIIKIKQNGETGENKKTVVPKGEKS